MDPQERTFNGSGRWFHLPGFILSFTCSSAKMVSSNPQLTSPRQEGGEMIFLPSSLHLERCQQIRLGASVPVKASADARRRRRSRRRRRRKMDMKSANGKQRYKGNPRHYISDKRQPYIYIYVYIIIIIMTMTPRESILLVMTTTNIS